MAVIRVERPDFYKEGDLATEDKTALLGGALPAHSITGLRFGL